MTDDERALLHETAETTRQLKRVFIDPPVGGGEPLVNRLMVALTVFERSGWSVKWGVRILLTVGAVGAAVMAMKGWFRP